MRGIPYRLAASSFAVATQGLRKQYGPTVVLGGVDLTVPEGSFYLLVGPNGAGKSTTFRILLDLLRADSGVAEVFGLDTTSGPQVRAQIGYVPERHEEPYGWMRVSQLIAHHASYFPTWDTAYAMRLASKLELRIDARYQRLSKGEARRVQLVMALAHRPPLLLLDEPTDGLDLMARESVLSILAEHLADSPTTVLASTHVVYELEGLADHLGVLRDGSICAQVTRDEMLRSMRSYTLEVADGWHETADLQNVLLRRNGRAREHRWTVWGDETHIVERLTNAGARVREVNPVSLQDAALALLTTEV
jgi:ABC-2 type transport system ATP-binding protein